VARLRVTWWQRCHNWSTKGHHRRANSSPKVARSVVGKGAKAYITCIAPQDAYRSCSGAVHVTDMNSEQPCNTGRRLSVRPLVFRGLSGIKRSKSGPENAVSVVAVAQIFVFLGRGAPATSKK